MKQYPQEIIEEVSRIAYKFKNNPRLCSYYKQEGVSLVLIFEALCDMFYYKKLKHPGATLTASDVIETCNSQITRTQIIKSLINEEKEISSISEEDLVFLN